MNQKQSRKAQGNVLVLTIAVAIVAILLAYFAFNYNQLMGAHQQAQSAIDAASLAVASDMSRVVVDGPLGRVALADDISASQSPTTSNGSNATATMQTDPHPIQSINTLLASLRLDATIASQPTVNNGTMLWLISQYLGFANTAQSQLAQSIVNGSAYDKYGNVINFQQDAVNAYNSFNKTLAGPGAAPIQSVNITFGTIANGPSTTVPTPMPNGIDAVTRGQTTYTSQKNYSVPGLGTNVQFIPTTTQVALIPASGFTSTAGGNIPPMAVEVTAVQPVSKMANANQSTNAPLTVVSYAQALVGGNGTLASATGTLVLTFPAGIPAGTSSAPAIGTAPPLNFTNVVGIINASQLDSTNANSTSPYSSWNAASTGNWQTSINGTVPGNGAYASQAFLGPSNVTGLNGHSNDDPSVSLAFLVVDWLRTLGLRPNVTSVVNALNYQYTNTTSNITFPLAQSVNETGSPLSSHNALASADWITPAYADRHHSHGQAIGVLRVTDDGVSDPRNLTNWAAHPTEFQRQQARWLGYQPAADTYTGDTKMAKLNDDGSVTTTDGHPVAVLNNLLNKIIAMDNYGMLTHNNVLTAVKSLIKGKVTKDATAAVFKAHPRLAYALSNAMYCTQIAMTMKLNLKVLTAIGANQISDNHFLVADSDFFPPTQAATIASLVSDSPANTGQDSAVTVRDWGAPPVKGSNNTVAPGVNFYKHASAPQIGTLPANDSWLTPALAQTAQQSNYYQFVFRVLGGAPQAGSGQIELYPTPVPASSPYANVPCLEGQAHYQDVAAVNMQGSDGTITQWQVQARDQNVNAFPNNANLSQTPQLDSSVQYFADMPSSVSGYNGQWCPDNGGQSCPIVTSEWSVTCPLVPGPPMLCDSAIQAAYFGGVGNTSIGGVTGNPLSGTFGAWGVAITSETATEVNIPDQVWQYTYNIISSSVSIVGGQLAGYSSTPSAFTVYASALNNYNIYNAATAGTEGTGGGRDLADIPGFSAVFMTQNFGVPAREVGNCLWWTQCDPAPTATGS